MRNYFLLGLIIASLSLIPAGIKAAAEYFPPRPQKPYVLLIGSLTSEFLINYVQEAVGKTVDVKLVNSKITRDEIASAAAVLFAINANMITECALDANTFVQQLPIDCCDKMPWEAQGFHRLTDGLLANPKQALIIHGILPDEEFPISNELKKIFGQNIFQLSHGSYVLRRNNQYNLFTSWLKNPTVSKDLSEVGLRKRTWSTSEVLGPERQRSEMIVTPCCDVVAEKLGISRELEKKRAKIRNAELVSKLRAMLNDTKQ